LVGTCGKKELENGARNLNKKARRNTTCTRPWHESPCSRFAGPTAHFCVALQQLCTEKGIRSDFGFEMDGTRRGAARARSVRVEIFGDVCGGTVAQLAVAVAASPSDKRNGVGRKRGRSDMKRGAISRLRIHHRALN
jgi:hypothetical protein